MLIKQNFNACCKALHLDAVSFAKLNRVVLMSRLVLGVALTFSSAEVVMAAPRDNQTGNDEASKSQQSESANSKSSNDPVGVNLDDNIRLRRALDEYSRTVDPAHVQIEERRRVMHQRLQERFSQTDRDNDGTISLEEAYDTMPQLARHFGAVDLNGDRLITMDELEALQAKIAERQRIASVKADSSESEIAKNKGKQSAANSRKNAL
jgi:hypothetical protein